MEDSVGPATTECREQEDFALLRGLTRPRLGLRRSAGLLLRWVEQPMPEIGRLARESEKPQVIEPLAVKQVPNPA